MADIDIDRLRRNLERTRSRIVEACARAKRNPSDVTLVAVTKTVDAATIRMLAELGVTDIGENRVRDANLKHDELASLNLRWHLIGHLQTNKASDAAETFDIIHSIDSERLAQSIGARCQIAGKTMPVLVQVNISGEESKSGLTAGQAPAEVEKIAQVKGIRVEGLMTMAPIVEDPETVRPVFAGLRELSEKIAALKIPGVGMKHLSMGMTQDFEVAIEEGATLVRVGTALFA